MGRYDDLIDLPHPVSKKHPRMSMTERAAQFSPFAALTGYDGAIRETARLTEGKIELSEEEKAALDLKNRMLMEALDRRPVVRVTFFRADARKEGGAYRTVTGRLKKVDEAARELVMTTGERIAMDSVIEMESEIFAGI